jgi:hypothetical protein
VDIAAYPFAPTAWKSLTALEVVLDLRNG